MADRTPPLSGGGSREHVSRIDRGYFQRPSRFQRTRRRVVLAAILAAAAWGVWAAFDVPRQIAPGPVAAVHAKWESDCSACHVPFAPIKDNTWFSTTASRQAMDGKCEACHRAAPHHPLQASAAAGSCASCHADHRGRDADLARVTDRTCTDCHGDIAAHRLVAGAADVSPSAVNAPITRFDDEHHPPFAGLAADPGRLKFSHGRHMRAGLSFEGPIAAGETPAVATSAGHGRATWTYAMLAPADRARYLPQGAGEQDPIQLSCGSCHAFGGAESAGRSIPGEFATAAPGSYALPVSFERHCAACHALPFEPTTSLDRSPEPTPADADAAITLVPPATGSTRPDTDAIVSASRTVPHGLDARALARFFETTFLEDALRDDPRLLDTGRAPRPLPAAATPSPVETSLRAVVAERFDRAVAFTRGTCEKCHEVESVPLPAGILAANPPRTALFGIGVGPTRVPVTWFTKAFFNHQPHRGFDCRECHAAAYPDVGAGIPAGSPIDSGMVMISGRESCTACHAPPGHDSVTGRAIGGVRFDCVECHRYHGLGGHTAPAAVDPTASPPTAVNR